MSGPHSSPCLLPHTHVQTPNHKQPAREKCPLPPVGRAGAKSGLEPEEDVAGKIDVTMVASTTPSKAAWSPAPVITAGRKEGRPPGSDALAAGSLYLPLQPCLWGWGKERASFLFCLPLPETRGLPGVSPSLTLLPAFLSQKTSELA